MRETTECTPFSIHFVAYRIYFVYKLSRIPSENNVNCLVVVKYVYICIFKGFVLIP